MTPPAMPRRAHPVERQTRFPVPRGDTGVGNASDAAPPAAPFAAAETTYLPGAAEVTGLAGARFSSTLELTNTGATGATVTIGLVPMAGRAAPAPATRTLGAGESLRISESLKTLFGLADGAAGTITVTSELPLLASLTTRNVAAVEGAYGLGLVAVPESELLGAGETGHSIWVSQSADPSTGYRTNLSVTLVDPGTVVEVRVLDAEGNVAGTATVTAGRPEVWQQPASSIAGAKDLPVGRAEFSVKAGRATAYAVVNDNVTSDAIALQAERVFPGATDSLISGAAGGGLTMALREIKIGASGVRGVVGDALTPELIVDFACAFGTWCDGGPVVVGRDTRRSSSMRLSSSPLLASSSAAANRSAALNSVVLTTVSTCEVVSPALTLPNSPCLNPMASAL